MRFIATCLAFSSAVSLGFNLPAHAENHAKDRKPANAAAKEREYAQAREQLAAQLAKNPIQGMKILDANGSPTTFENVANDARSFSDGVIVETESMQVRVRGELLDDGKNGILLMATREVGGRAVTGQVLTLKPGITKLEFENRLQDLALSLTSEFASTKKIDGQRKVAADNVGSPCLMTVLAAVVAMVFMAGAFKFKAMNPVRGHLVLAQIATIMVMVSAMIQTWAGLGQCVSRK